MLKALPLIARWISRAHDRWCAATAARRLLAVEVAILEERVVRLWGALSVSVYRIPQEARSGRPVSRSRLTPRTLWTQVRVPRGAGRRLALFRHEALHVSRVLHDLMAVVASRVARDHLGAVEHAHDFLRRENAEGDVDAAKRTA